MSSSMSDIVSPSAGPAVSIAVAAAPSSALAAPQPPVVAPTPRYRTFTFGIGFLCGQASLIFIAILFLRYVVFEDPKKALHEAGQRKKKRLRNKQRQRRGSAAPRGAKSGSKFAATTSIPASDQLILSKLSYDISTHAAESCDWLNVLVAQAVSAYRSMILDEAMNYSRNSGHETSDDDEGERDGDKPGGGRGAKRYVEKALNTGRGEGEEKSGSGIVALDYITVTEFDFGQEYPVCSNARVRPSNESGKVVRQNHTDGSGLAANLRFSTQRIEVDVDYSDHVSLAVETKVLINFPRPKFAVIPVNLALALVQFSATLTIEVPPPSFTPISGPGSPSNAKASMSLSLHPDFILDLASTSLIGSRAKLQDIPKVEQLIIGRIRNYVIENFVWPKVRTFNLPKVGGKKPPVPVSTPPVAVSDTGGDIPSEMSSEYDAGMTNKRQSTPNGESGLRSPSSGSAIEDEEDEDFDEDDLGEEEAEDSPIATNKPPLRVQTAVTPDGRDRRYVSGSMVQPVSQRLSAQSSAIEEPHHAGEAHRRLRRGSSLSSSTTASDLLATSSRRTSGSSATRATSTLSPPGLSTSTSSRSETGSTVAAQDLRYRGPLHSPGLGIGLKSASSKRHSIQAYLPSSTASYNGQYSPFPPISAAYSNHLSRTSSVTSLPTLLSPRAEQPSTSKLAELLDAESPRWEAARRAADGRRTYETRSSAKKKRLADNQAQHDAFASPTSKVRPKGP